MRRLGMGLCLSMYVAASTAAMPSSGNAPIKAFLAHTDVKYGSDADARTLEGRLYAWAKSGASVAALQTRAAKQFELPRELADRLVLLTLQRGAGKDQDKNDSALIDRYIALAHAYPQSQLAMIEAGRTINAPFDDCDVAAYERLLQGRPHADADRITLFNQFSCFPLLTERTANHPRTTEPYLTLATDGGSSGNALLDLAILRLADEKARNDPGVSVHDRFDIRVRRVAEELGQGRLEDAVALLPSSPSGMDRTYHDLLGPETRRAIAAAYLALGQVAQAQAWRDDLSADSASTSAGSMSKSARANAVLDGAAEAMAGYQIRLLDRLLHPSADDAFDLLVERHRLSTAGEDAYWRGLWTRLYDRFAIEHGYPGFAQEVERPATADKLAETRADALRRCYRCAQDLLEMVGRVANEPMQLPGAAPQAGDVSRLPAPMLKTMEAMMVAARPGWAEHSLPDAMRTPHPKAKPRSMEDMLVAPTAAHAVAPAWARRLPGGELVRYEQQGRRVVALTVSQSLDPTGEISAGGYWISLSDDGGEHFQAPLYTGLRMFEPYVVAARSKLPMLAGDHLQLEVAVRQLDDEHVMLPPISLPMKAQRNDLYLDIPLADLARDTDGDGLTDIAEWAMLLDPKNADTDGDGMPDGRDPLPQVAASHGADLHASALVAVLANLFDKSLGAIVTTSATGAEPAQAHAITGSTDNYNSARAIFIQAPAAYFSGVAMRGRMIVLNTQQAAALEKARGRFFVMSMPVFEVSHDGKQALVVWSSGWSGGTYLLTKQGDQWKVEPLQSWIT